MLVAGVTTSALTAFTVSAAVRVVLPFPLVVLVNEMVAGNVPGVSALALALTVNVTVVGELVTVPELTEAVSQDGMPVMEKLTLPELALSWYWNEGGENGPP